MPGGLIIVTLKLPGTGRYRDDLIVEMEKRLGGVLYDLQVVWLVNNTLSERCLIGKMRAQPCEKTLSTVWWAEGVVPREKGALGNSRRGKRGKI